MRSPLVPDVHAIFGVIATLFGLFGAVLVGLILLGVLVLLVRFLIAGTRAAQLYIDAHAPGADAAPAPDAETTTPARALVSDVDADTHPTPPKPLRPPTKPRSTRPRQPPPPRP